MRRIRFSVFASLGAAIWLVRGSGHPISLGVTIEMSF